MILSQAHLHEISENISKDFDFYYSKYDFKKYSASDYEKFKFDFSSLNSDNSSIEAALKWKWGHAGKLNYPEKQKKLIEFVKNNWKNSTELRVINPLQTFNYWRESRRDFRYITAAFITHLVHYNDIPIIDQHNFRAMNFFLKNIKKDFKAKKIPSNWDDLQNFKYFLDNIANHTQIDKEKLDKYLMMFGKSIK